MALDRSASGRDMLLGLLRKLSVLSVAALSFSLAFAGNVVIPPANVTTGGNTKAPLPTSGSIEIQELIGGGPIPASPITITGLSFRAAPGAGPISGSIGNLSVSLSTSPNSPNSSSGSLMSSTFTSNTGKDKTLVFSGTNIVLQSAGCAGPASCPFDININFQTPFTYSRNGGLLIDIIETGVSTTSGTLDAASFSAPGGTVAQVIGDPSSGTGTFAYQGNVVQLNYTSSAPSITGLVNVANSIPVGMPNYGLARGSLFAVYGSNLGPANLVVASLPLPTAAGLSGVSLQIVVSGTAVNAPVYFARNDIIVGIMPSNTALGNGSLNVSYNGRVGTYPLTVTQSNFGISSSLNPTANNGIGVLGSAAVTFPDYRTVTPTSTAKPGDILTVWGTGLGATQNGNDTAAPPAGNIGDMPQVFVGGVPSPSVSYWGRAPGGIPGLDQINFQVPADAPLGCNVSIVVETMNGATPVVSNAPTIAVGSADSASCSDATQLRLPTNLGASSLRLFSFGVVEFYRATYSSKQVQAGFFKLDPTQAAALTQQFNVQPSIGTCYFGINASSPAKGNLDAMPLNAGPSLAATAAAFPFPQAMTSSSGGGSYQSQLTSPIAHEYPGGTWTLSSSGGPDVGGLNLKLSVPQPVTWSAPSTASRSNPLTITWSGGDSNGYVDIQAVGQVADIAALAQGRPGGGVFNYGFECTAPASAHQVTIPTSVLQAMRNAQDNLLQLTLVALSNSLGPVQTFDFTIASTQFQIIQLITFTN